ncbi:MAG TPA: hypothetical protein VGO93_07970, partial [Candidatus Xenobia bacterium]
VLKRSGNTSGVLAANLFGAMLGGLLEYNAMYLGYHSLYYLAMVMYLGAAVGALWPRRVPA